MGKPGKKAATKAGTKAGTKAKGITAVEPEKETTDIELSPLDADKLIVASKDLAVGYNAPQPPAKKQKKASPLVPTTKVIPVPENLLVANTTKTTRNPNLPSRPAGVQKTSVPVIAPITQPSKADSEEAEEDEEDEENKEEDVVEEAAKDTTHRGEVGDGAKDTNPDKKASRASLIAMLSKDQKDHIISIVIAHMHKEFTFRALSNRAAAQKVVGLCAKAAILKGALKCSMKEYIKAAFNRYRSAQMKQIYRKMVLAREVDPVQFSQAEFMESVGLSPDGVFPCETVQSQNARRADHSKKKRKASSE